MQPNNALQQMLKSQHQVNDPGDTQYITVDRDRMYCSITASTTETRSLHAPKNAGLVCHLGCLSAQTVTVTAYYWTESTRVETSDATITFSAASQWISLLSVETTAGVYKWAVTDMYGCATGLLVTGNYSAAVQNGTVTNLLGTSASIGSIQGTNISASNASAINLVVQTGLSVKGNFNVGASIFTSGGTSATVAATKWSTVQQLTNSLCFVSATNATNNYFRLPAVAVGLAVDIVNIGSAAAIIPDVSAVVMRNFSGGTTTHLLSLASGGAAANAVALVCDGTQWWQRANVVA